MSVGRPKGRNKVQVSISLTLQQREWLITKPNSSALICGLIDALKSVDDLNAEHYQFIVRKTKLESIESKLNVLKKEKQMFMFQGGNRMHFKGSWVDDDEREGSRYYRVENFNDPEPIDNEGQILKREMQLITDAINRLETEAEKIKAEMSQSK